MNHADKESEEQLEVVLHLFTTLQSLLRGNTKHAARQFNCYNNESLKCPQNQSVQNQFV